MDKGNNNLHVVVFPWLAMGHFIPFLKLSKALAEKGHNVSFISTPRNISRLPKIPRNLEHLIQLVSIPMPKVDNLPEGVESSMDVTRERQRFLKMAFDLLQSPIATFLEEATVKPDWIIIDYASHWLPKIASRMGILVAYFGPFTAASLAFYGPPSILLNEGDGRSTAESYTIVPRWIPFPSNIFFRLHEIVKAFEDSSSSESGTPDGIRFALSIDGSDLVVVRTSVEFEPEWFNLLCQLYNKPVASLGVLPPSLEKEEDEESGWVKIKNWLDKKSEEKVVYVALGTEATLTETEVQELALGLEQSEIPFFWVLRKPPSSNKEVSDMLPEGFLGRIEANGGGIVYTEWVPQVKILSHQAIGAYLTHCGWNSVIEALSFGRVLIMFPVTNDQGLNARLLEGKNVGVEIPRNAEDGFFTATAVADTIRFAMVSKEAESIRVNASKMASIFGDPHRNQSCIDNFIHTLEQGRGSL